MLAAKGALGEFGRGRQADIDRQAAETLYGRQMEQDRQRALVAAKVAEDKERRLREMQPGTYEWEQLKLKRFGGPKEAARAQSEEQRKLDKQLEGDKKKFESKQKEFEESERERKRAHLTRGISVDLPAVDIDLGDVDVTARIGGVKTAEAPAVAPTIPEALDKPVAPVREIAELKETRGQRMVREQRELADLKSQTAVLTEQKDLAVAKESAQIGIHADNIKRVGGHYTQLANAMGPGKKFKIKALERQIMIGNTLMPFWAEKGLTGVSDVDAYEALHGHAVQRAEDYRRAMRFAGGKPKQGDIVHIAPWGTWPNGSTQATEKEVRGWMDSKPIKHKLKNAKLYNPKELRNEGLVGQLLLLKTVASGDPEAQTPRGKPGELLGKGGRGGGTKALDRVRGLKGGTLGQEKTISTSLASFESKLTATVTQMTNEGMFDNKGNVLEEFRDTEQAQQLGRLNKQIDRWEEIQGDIDRGTITAQQGVEKVKKDLPRAAPGPTDAQLQQGTERHLGSIRTSSFNPFQGAGSREEQTEKFARASRGANQAISYMKGRGGVAVGLTKQLKDEKEKRLKMFADDVFADIAQEVGKTKDKNRLDALQEEGERLRRKLGLSGSHPSVTKIRAALADVGVEAGREGRHQVEEIQSQKGFVTLRQSGPGPQMLQLQ